MALFFISYSKLDGTQYAHELKDRVEMAGLPTWMDTKDIATGKEWREVIKNAIETSICVIVVLTPGALDSRWVNHEWSMAKGANKAVIPILFEKVDEKILDKDPISQIQYRDFTQLQSRDWVTLLDELKRVEAEKAVNPTVANAENILNSPEPEKWAGAIETLRQIEHNSAIEALARLVNGPLPEVSIRASIALAEKSNYQDQRAILGLKRLVYWTSSLSGYGSGSAWMILEKMNSEDVVVCLSDIIGQINSSLEGQKIKRDAIDTLAKLTHPSALSKIRELFMNPFVRQLPQGGYLCNSYYRFSGIDSLDEVIDFLREVVENAATRKEINHVYRTNIQQPIEAIIKNSYPEGIKELADFICDVKEPAQAAELMYYFLDYSNQMESPPVEPMSLIAVHPQGVSLYAVFLERYLHVARQWLDEFLASSHISGQRKFLQDVANACDVYPNARNYVWRKLF